MGRWMRGRWIVTLRLNQICVTGIDFDGKYFLDSKELATILPEQSQVLD